MIELKSITKYYMYEGDNITYYDNLNIAVKKYIVALKNSKNDIIFFGIQYSNGEYGTLEKDIFIGNNKFFRLCDNVENVTNLFKINLFNKIKKNL